MISVVKWTVLMSVMDTFLKMVLNWMVVVWIVLMKMFVICDFLSVSQSLLSPGGLRQCLANTGV